MLTRRAFAATALPAFLNADTNPIGDLEKANGGRLGVAIIDLETGKRMAYRADERFPFCSTFKFLLAAAVLQRVDRGKNSLTQELPVPAKPLVGNSPLTAPHAGGTMTIAALCHAALTRSDNTAANVLLEVIGGPKGMTAFARSIGDKVTRLDRIETALNEALDGDPRDTTSPNAMAANLKTILLGNVLKTPSRQQLTAWMESSVTGLEKLRAGLPSGWKAVDKTGSNGEHTSNDIAVFWPTGRKPILVAAYITQCFGPEAKRAAMFREIAKLATK